MLWSILWSIVQVCLQTTKYQVYQYEPNTNISEQFESKLWTILILTQCLFEIDGYPCMVLRLCFIVESFLCKFAIFFHTFLCVTFHVIGPWRYRFRHQVSLKLRWVVFPQLQQKFWIRTYLFSLSQCHYLLYFRFEYNPNVRGRRNHVGSPDQRLPWKLSKSVLRFLFLPASLISSTHTDRKSPLARLTNKQFQLKKLFPNSVPKELSQLTFPTIVLPEDDRTDFFREERLVFHAGPWFWPLVLW